MPKVVKPKRTKSHWYDGTTPFEELDATQQAAHGIVADRADLTPSVERIMSAELTEEQRQQALQYFADALVDPASPDRDPRVAIEHARTDG